MQLPLRVGEFVCGQSAAGTHFGDLDGGGAVVRVGPGQFDGVEAPSAGGGPPQLAVCLLKAAEVVDEHPHHIGVEVERGPVAGRARRDSFFADGEPPLGAGWLMAWVGAACGRYRAGVLRPGGVTAWAACPLPSLAHDRPGSVGEAASVR